MPILDRSYDEWRVCYSAGGYHVEGEWYRRKPGQRKLAELSTTATRLYVERRTVTVTTGPPERTEVQCSRIEVMETS